MIKEKKIWSGSTTCDICGTKINHGLYTGERRSGRLQQCVPLVLSVSEKEAIQRTREKSKTKQFKKVVGLIHEQGKERERP